MGNKCTTNQNNVRVCCKMSSTEEKNKNDESPPASSDADAKAETSAPAAVSTYDRVSCIIATSGGRPVLVCT